MNKQSLETQISNVCTTYKGNAEKLRNAIGVTFLCEQYGWKTIKLIHSIKAWRQYKAILGIDFEKEFPEETRLSEKFIAYRVWKATGRFWDTRMNRTITPENKRDIVEQST